MDLSQSFGAVDSSTPLLLTHTSCEIEERGHVVDTPVFHIRGRDAAGNLETFEVEGFRPYFGVTLANFIAAISDITADRRVLGVECDCSPDTWADVLDIDDPDAVSAKAVSNALTESTGADIYHDPNPNLTLDDEPTARIICRVQDDISGQSGMAADLDCKTFEADIPFVRRFLISAELYRGVVAPTDSGRIRYENWHGESNVKRSRKSDSPIQQDLEPCEPPDVDPRMVIYDIEVATEDDGFPSPEHARHPITSISAYDSYSDEYVLFGLEHDNWSDNSEGIKNAVCNMCSERSDFPDVSDVTLELYATERELLVEFNEWVLDCDPDIFTGYNSDGFDTPYLIQRCYNVNVRNIKQYTDTGDPGVWVETYDDQRQINYKLQDRSTLDIMTAYKKTQFRELDSYTLDSVANAEVGAGKEGLNGDELDEAWQETPVSFFAYSLRDAQVTALVEQESGLIDLFENLREVTGAQWDTATSNGPMLDTLFLRRGYEKGIILPTNTAPDENVYHGAKVLDVEPGIHANCVYPDLSSMYPNLFAMLNLGSETIIGGEEALAASEYTEADCYTFPVDNRDFARVPKGTSYDYSDSTEYKGVKTPDGAIREMFDPVYEWEYVLKPEIKESFVRDTVDELIDLKNRFTGDMYGAVKRVTNSIYGIAGDSESGGKGFRLYDRKVAEGITMAGRLTIQHTADEFTTYLQDNYDPDALLVGGDTDSSTTSIPNAPDLTTAHQWAMDAIEYVDNSYDDFAMEQFGTGPDEHRLKVELESLASKLFYMRGDTEHSYTTDADGMLVSEVHEDGVQKRYAQHLVWEDDSGWLDTADPDEYDEAILDPEDRSDLKFQETVTYDTYENGPLAGMDPHDYISITGFEYVRSDSAQVTRDAQEHVFADILLSESVEDDIQGYLYNLVESVTAGDVSLENIARPKGMSNPLDDYGWKDIDELNEDDITDETEEYGGHYRQKPGPTYRGAKYANDWLPWEDISPGSKPRKIPIEKVRGDEYPQAYEYHSYPESERPDSPEVGIPVDAIAVENPDRLPEQFIVNYDAIVEKELKGKIEPITETIGLNWEDCVNKSTQTGLDAFV